MAVFAYLVATNEFRHAHQRFFSWCYNVAILPFLVFMIGGMLIPAWRHYESLGRFIIYMPLVAIFFGATICLPIAVANIACKIKMRGEDAQEFRWAEKLWRLAMYCFLVVILSAVISAGITFFVGIPMIALMVGISIYRAVCLLAWTINRMRSPAEKR